MVIVAIEAQDSLRAKYLENAYSVAMSTLAVEAFREQSTPGASDMLGVWPATVRGWVVVSHC